MLCKQVEYPQQREIASWHDILTVDNRKKDYGECESANIRQLQEETKISSHIAPTFSS